MISIIDSHSHIDVQAFDIDREEVISRAKQAGVSAIINIGATDGLLGAKRTITLSEQYEFIFASVGIHPHDTGQNLDFAEIEALAKHPKVVAIGETGLDFYRDWAPKNKQEEYFTKHIELAVTTNKPLIIHSREAGNECLEFIKSASTRSSLRGVFHCYSEDANFATELSKLGFLVSFPGNLTFPKAEQLRHAARQIPIEQILLETDAPYLAPVPFRGKRCESAQIIETAKMLAAIKKVSLEDIAKQTRKNTVKLFSLPESLL